MLPNFLFFRLTKPLIDQIKITFSVQLNHQGVFIHYVSKLMCSAEAIVLI